jgi:hypothetical protein
LVKAVPSESFINVNDKNYLLLLDKKEDCNYYFKQTKVNDSYDGDTIIAHVADIELEDMFLTI